MRGPEHYLRAESLIAASYDTVAENDDTNPAAMVILAEAQVHATLALAAATALGSLRADDHGMSPKDGNAWIVAASGDPEYVALAMA
jgi:hypothetical protein